MRPFIALIAVLLSVSLLFFNGTDSPPAESITPYTDPVVFVHGYKGSARSFNTLIHRFEQNGWGEKALMLTVTRQGRLLASEQPVTGNQPAFIQLVFENNRASFEDTANMLASAMQVLRAQYGIESVSIVGHSMGGIVSVKFLQEQWDKSLHPAVEKFVAVGSPFDGVAGGRWFVQNEGPAKYDLMPGSPALAQIASNHHRFPKGLQTLTIAAVGDQVTPIASALSLRGIVPKEQYKAIVLYDPSITHSGLHESPAVDEKIGAFLGYTGN